MKAFRGEDLKLQALLNSELDGSELSTSCPNSLIPGKKSRYHLNSMLVGSQSRSRRVAEEITLVPPGIRAPDLPARGIFTGLTTSSGIFHVFCSLVTTFRRNVPYPSSVIKIETASDFRTLIAVCHTTRRHVPEGRSLHTHRLDGLTYLISKSSKFETFL